MARLSTLHSTALIAVVAGFTHLLAHAANLGILLGIVDGIVARAAYFACRLAIEVLIRACGTGDLLQIARTMISRAT